MCLLFRRREDIGVCRKNRYSRGLPASYVVTPSGQTQPSVSMAFSYREDELGQAVVSGTSVTAPYTDTYIYGLNGAPLELLRQQSGSTNRYWYVLDGRDVKKRDRRSLDTRED